MSQLIRSVALLLACAVMLGACELGATQAPDATPTGETKAAPPDAAAAQPYPAPESPAVPTLAPAPAPAAPAAQALVGAEWTVLASGDLNADTRPDVVGVKLAQGVTPDATFRQPGYAGYKGPAAEVVIVQTGADGKPQIQAILTGGGLSANGAGLASFSGAAGYMVFVSPGARPLVSILAINTAGAPIGGAVGLEWNGSAYVRTGSLSK
jgi:hypothetical protein